MPALSLTHIHWTGQRSSRPKPECGNESIITESLTLAEKKLFFGKVGHTWTVGFSKSSGCWQVWPGQMNELRTCPIFSGGVTFFKQALKWESCCSFCSLILHVSWWKHWYKNDSFILKCAFHFQVWLWECRKFHLRHSWSSNAAIQN